MLLAVGLLLCAWFAGCRSHPTDALSSVTFEQLAEVLYQRGDKAENRLSRKYLYNSNVTCNDGSAAGYYIRRRPGAKQWVVFLEGGWYCYDAASCESRWMRLRSLMSSKRWPEVVTKGGILSSDAEENPPFHGANHVLVPYCSSDSWAGTARAGHGGGSRFAFMGAEIVGEVIRELFSWEQLGSAKELYLAGSSSGGIGVLVNLDPVAELVRSLGGGARVRGIVDSAWFLDTEPHAGGLAASPSRTIVEGAHMWRARVPDSCAKTYPGDEWKCFFGYRIYPTLNTPLFVFQWQFDEEQMKADIGVALSGVAQVTKEQWEYSHLQARNIRRTFESVPAVFAPSCISHTIITKPDWAHVSVDGVSLPSAIACWAAQTHPGEEEDDLQEADTDQDLMGQKKQTANYLQNDYSRISMLADSPQVRFRGASNLVKSLDSGRYPNSNSMGHRVHKYRHHRKVVDNRTGQRKGNKHKRRHKKRCRHDDTLEGRIKCAKEDNERFLQLGMQNDMEAGGGKFSNRDLLRSLDRRSYRDKKRRRRRRRRQRRVTQARSGKKLGREERRRTRKSGDKRRRRNREKGGGHSLTVRSVRTNSKSAKCQTKLVDVCSWPHCNRSCPKLHNPFTGEEMNFQELLKSFGLNMASVAQALGIDIGTLNNMDQDMLRHLLTSQSHQQ